MQVRLEGCRARRRVSCGPERGETNAILLRGKSVAWGPRSSESDDFCFRYSFEQKVSSFQAPSINHGHVLPSGKLSSFDDFCYSWNNGALLVGPRISLTPTLIKKRGTVSAAVWAGGRPACDLRPMILMIICSPKKDHGETERAGSCGF